MFDLEKEVGEQFSKMNESGLLSEMIEKKLSSAIEKSIADSIDSIFRYNGDGKKKIEEAVKKALDFDVEKLEIPSYRNSLLNMVKDKLNEITFKDMDVAVKAVDKLISEEVPESVSFEDLMYKFIDDVKEDDKTEYEGEISIHVDDRESLVFIQFDKGSDIENYSCAYNLVLHQDGKIHSFEFENKGHQSKYQFGESYNYTIADYIYKLYVNGTKITDVQDCDTESIKHWDRDY